MKDNNDAFIVKYVTFEYTRLIDEHGTYNPKVRVYDAMRIARDTGFNLVCLNRPNNNELALCKIMDYGKWQYENEKKLKKQESENRHKVKEVKFTPDIADNDIVHKVKRVNEFLEDGDGVILAMKLSGRQKAHFGLAEDKMSKILVHCSGKVVSTKKSNDMIIVRLEKT